MRLALGIAILFWGQVYALPVWQTQVLDEAARLYEPAAQAEHVALNFITPLNQADLIASAENNGVSAVVRIDGGVFSSSRLTPDSLRITICHELGHIFGGAVRRHVPPEWDGAVADDGLSLMSSEGEADYYATLVCFRKMIEGQDHRAALGERKIPDRTKTKCEHSWGIGTDDALACERTALASLDFLNFVVDFPISLERNAPEVVAEPIIDQYPTRQCRLDTLVAGALCRTSYPLQLDRNQAATSDCPQLEARRPACWYPHHDAVASL